MTENTGVTVRCGSRAAAIIEPSRSSVIPLVIIGRVDRWSQLKTVFFVVRAIISVVRAVVVEQ